MVRKVKHEVPVEEINDFSGAVGDVVEIFQINSQVDKDAKEFQLTPDEVNELRDAYVLESSMGGGVHNFRHFNNMFRNGKKIRSSQEIVQDATERNQEKAQDTLKRQPGMPDQPSDILNTPSITPNDPSILDYLRQGVNAVGGAVVGLGKATFNMAASLGQETLGQMVQLALNGGANGKDMLHQAVQLAAGNMLMTMHQQTLAEITKLLAPQQIEIPGLGGEVKVISMTEEFMNNPANQNVFKQVVERVLETLGVGTDGRAPHEVVMDEVGGCFGRGEFKVPNGAVLPKIYTRGQKSPLDQLLDVLGIKVPVGYPEGVIVENERQDGLPPVYRRADGQVVVRAHNRNGRPVREYVRTVADGDLGNNLGGKVGILAKPI